MENFLPGIRIEEIWTAKFSEGNVRKFDIAFTGINPWVHILGVPRLCMVNKSKAADNQISDSVLVKQMKQIFKTLNGLHRFY